MRYLETGHTIGGESNFQKNIFYRFNKLGKGAGKKLGNLLRQQAVTFRQPSQPGQPYSGKHASRAHSGRGSTRTDFDRGPTPAKAATHSAFGKIELDSGKNSYGFF